MQRPFYALFTYSFRHLPAGILFLCILPTQPLSTVAYQVRRNFRLINGCLHRFTITRSRRSGEEEFMICVGSKHPADVPFKDSTRVLLDKQACPEAPFVPSLKCAHAHFEPTRIAKRCSTPSGCSNRWLNR